MKYVEHVPHCSAEVLHGYVIEKFLENGVVEGSMLELVHRVY